MLCYILSRLVALAVSLVVASLVIFVMIELVPGDPASFMLGLNAAPDTVAALRAELGLGGSLVERYLHWVGGMLQGDFGTSYTYRAPVAELVTARLAVSLPLALMALLLSTLIAIPVGLYAASHRGKPGDWSVMGLTQLGIAIPNFWFAIILVVIFAIKLRWFSAGGFPGWDEGIWPSLKALTLPAVALALPQASILARVMRSAVLEVLGHDYIRTARAKGLSPAVVLFKHALRNAIIPVVALAAVWFGFMLGGSIVIETIFNLKGIGWLSYDALLRSDLPVVQAIVLIFASFYVVLTLLADLLNAYLDPRISVR